MGVVQRQGAKHSLVSVFALVLGVVNNLFIYARYADLYGYAQSVMSLVALFMPFASFGVHAVMKKFHGRFITNTGKYEGLLRLALRWILLLLIGFGIIYFLFLDALIDFLRPYFPNIALIEDGKLGIFVLVALSSVTTLLISFCDIKQRIVIPQILRRVLHDKMLLPVLILAAALLTWDDQRLLYGLIALKLILITGLALYLNANKWLYFGKASTPALNKADYGMKRYGLYTFLNSLGAKLAIRIDIIMVGVLLGNQSAGFYAIFIFLANVIDIPKLSMGKLLVPMIARDWDRNDKGAIQEKYKRTGVGLFAISIFLFLGIDLNIEEILIIIKQPDLISARFVFLFVALAYIIDAGNALNGTIITQSDKYDRHLLFTLLLGVINVFLTYYFIVHVFDAPYKPAGAACATAISLIVFNLLKTAYVQAVFGMNPYSLPYLWITVLGAVSYAIIYILPDSSYPVVNIIYRGIAVSILYGIPVYYFRLSLDVNQICDKYVVLLLRRLGLKRFLHWRA